MLRAAGLDPVVLVSGLDESTVDTADARELCTALARLKAEAVVARMREAGEAQDQTLVLGCDSVLELAGEIYGKPADDDDAAAAWRRMRGRIGTLHTGHCLIDAGRGEQAEGVASTSVTFANVSDEEIAAYVATGEPVQMAGAFTIDGLGGWFVDRVDGDHGTVIGVSLPLLRRLLTQVGAGVPALWGAVEGHPVRSVHDPEVDRPQ